MDETKNAMNATDRRGWQIGFRASIITVFIAAVLFVGLTLVYLSFNRVTSITRTAAGTFIDKVAQLGADRIDAQFRTIRDNLGILGGLPSIQAAEIDDNPKLYALMAAMLRNTPQLFNLYVGYEDGSFLEIDLIDRANPVFRANLGVPEDAVFRMVAINRSATPARAQTIFLSDNLITIEERPGPADYDPRRRPWYIDAFKDEDALVTGPYLFYATRDHGYTLRSPLQEGRRGVIAGDILLAQSEAMLDRQRLGNSGLVFLFNDAGQIVAHPNMSILMEQASESRHEGLPKLDAVKLTGLPAAIRSWRQDRESHKFFSDAAGMSYVAAFHTIETAGSANIRLAVVARLDEFFSSIIAERRALFAVALGFVLASLPLAFWMGSLMARSLRALASQTDEIQKFQIIERPRLRSIIQEIDELGRSVFTMRTVIRNFSSFIPKQIVRQLIESGTSLELGGTRREITVLFTDVADFTAKTEKADPSQVMIYTSRYFAALSEEIMSRHGTVDKFIGDAVMAFWNAPADDPNHVANACAAVLACLQRNEQLNGHFEEEGWPPYKTRFGLHTGDAVVGNIGSVDRMNFTALGATINLTARLEGLNKDYGTRVLVSSAVRARAEQEFLFRSVDCIRPKGFAEPVTISELRGRRADATAAELDICRRWEDIHAAIMRGERDGILARLTGFLIDYPDDGVARHHARHSVQSMPGAAA
ncbi:adenylate/guanylate cyclase domain-containing protein [Bradyrhizobium manausense]|uniref:adenylate/guanylate cyclase domain-containing protein n=1 Tax=Bradyrhizobium TaxID=374 RepID=UPI001BA97559|nr:MULTISPECIES: adenylate/guanylate cyclase domain-containing protein [Bradyrhizobium]MBR0824538.1 adenylate/guanylate cyclase domain-containing protein [Bradyrhizobium manausense]UVO29668.1 adenylate/guanylate cyclase domain-containing protein [Bradyrhizobium arachidis]